MVAIRVDTSLSTEWVPRIQWVIEALWLLTAALVPLIFVNQEFMLSEAVNAYVEVPTTTALRTLVGMMTILVIVEWILKGGLTRRYSFAGYSVRLVRWVAQQPGRWLAVAAVAYMATTLISTFLSANFYISVWGEVSGQYGYSAYTNLSYVLMFGIIATHLKTQDQLWRLLGVIVATGALVALYGIIQRYGGDPLDVGEAGAFRVASTMANPVFAGAALVVTTLLTWGIGVVALDRLGWSSVRIVSWVLLLATQLMAVYFTDARGSWMIGVPMGVAGYLYLPVLVGFLNHLARRERVPRDLLFLVGALGLMTVLLFFTLTEQFDLPGIPGVPASEFLRGLLGVLMFGSVLVLLDPSYFSADARSFAKTFLLLASALAVTVVVVSQTPSPSVSTDLDLRDFASAKGWVWLAVLVPLGLLALAVLQLPERFGERWQQVARPAVAAASALLLAVLLFGVTLSSGGGAAAATPSDVDSVEEEVSSVAAEASGRGRSFRTDIWSASYRLIVDRTWFEYEDLRFSILRPLVGYGPEMFKYTFPLESPLGGLLSQSHNFFIHHAVEQGLLGFFSSVGLVLAFFGVGAAQLVRNWSTYSSTHRWVLLALMGAMIGRVAEFMVGVNRESDLVTFWIILAIMVVLPSVMVPQESTAASSEPARPATRQDRRRASRTGRGQRRARGTQRAQDIQVGPVTLIASVVVSVLVLFLGWLTWDKNIDYAWAAVIAADARDSFSSDLPKAHRLMSDAIDKAPDVPIYYQNLSSIYDIYRRNAVARPDENLPPCEVFFDLEFRESASLGDQPYARCTEEAYLSNLEGYKKNVTSPQAKLALANSTLQLALVPGYADKGDEAIRWFEELTDMLPSSVPLTNQLARTHLVLGNYAQALEPLEDSLAISGRNSTATEALYLRGIAYANLASLDQAIDSFNEALALAGVGANTSAIEGQLVNAYNTKAGNLIQEEPEAALDPLEKSLAVSRDSRGSGTALYLQGLAFQLLDRLEESAESLEQSLEVSENGPNALNAHQQLANVYASLGDLERAAEHFRLSQELGG